MFPFLPFWTPPLRATAARRRRRSTHRSELLALEGPVQLQVVGEGPHGDGQLADHLEVDRPAVGGGDEGVHPPVGGLGQQVDEGLQEAHTQVLEVLWGLHLGGVGEAHVALQGPERRIMGTEEGGG